MGGPGGVSRPLQPNEKAIVTFVVFGTMTKAQQETFNKALQKLLDEYKGTVTSSEVHSKAPGDPN